MILRRVIRHFRNQEWTAIFLDFLIVVVGVFVGLQVSNWNDESQAALRESVVMEQLHNEFVTVVEATKKSKNQNDTVVKASLDLLRIIRSGEEPEDKARLLVLINLVNVFSSATTEPATLLELISSGRLSELSSPSLRRALIRFHEAIGQHQRRSNIVLERISAPHDGFHSAFYLNPDFKTRDKIIDKYDWDRVIEAREQLQVLLIGTQGLSGQMEELIARAQSVLLEIEVSQK